MKKISLLFSFIPFLFAFQCEDDVACGNFVEFENTNLITIENPQAIYQLGDTLWLASSVNRLQTNTNSNTVIDLFQLDESLSYYIELKKASAFNGFNYINLNENSIVIDTGGAFYNTFILLKEADHFVSRAGIKLLESGSYTVNIYNVASYNPERQGCNFTVISMLTNFAGLENNSFIFEVE